MGIKEYLQPDNSIDIVSSEGIKEYELFFGAPTEETKPFILERADKISDVLVALGLAQSKGWCRKNNWDWKLRPGWNWTIFGKTRIYLYIYIEANYQGYSGGLEYCNLCPGASYGSLKAVTILNPDMILNLSISETNE